ncbi:bifunctional UDP-N-acetylglucosamine diphosphorylase/glucosamine-1-phosphate N-acetyltransferase GlmU [soil metagenome]
MTPSANQRSDSERVAVAVLAAGIGSRMKSATAKSLHPVAGVPIIERVIRAGLAIDPDQMVVVVSEGLIDLPDRLGMNGEFEATTQVYPYGTAGAVRSAFDHLAPAKWLVSLLGDSPLLTGDSVRELIDGARQTGSRVTILTCVLDDAQTYGRIERDTYGNARRIVEFKNDLAQLRSGPTEINSGIMVLDAVWAREALVRLKENAQAGELMLTDILEIAIEDMQPHDPWPIATVAGHPDIALGINDRTQLGVADAVIRQRVRAQLQRDGVTIVGADTVFIDETVRIGRDTTILPFSTITGSTFIGSDCQIGPNAVLHNAQIADRVVVKSSTVTDSTIGEGTDVGPYSHIRDGAEIDAGVHIGTSAEIKNSAIGSGGMIGHFSYLGDATIGQNVNVGAGSITANFDGVNKHRTTIGDSTFLGCDTVLIAPIEIGADARTGAGSIVNRNVPAAATVVGMPARQIANRKSETVLANVVEKTRE